MTERQIERVVVTEGSRIAGTLGMAEVLAHFASHSHLISLGLARARDIDAIAEAASGMTRLVRSLNVNGTRSEEHTSELQSLMRISYAVFCLKQKTQTTIPQN